MSFTEFPIPTQPFDASALGIPRVYDTAQDLRDAPWNASAAITLGCNAVGDGGGGVWRPLPVAAAETYADNTGTILVPSGGDGSVAMGRDWDGTNANILWWGPVRLPTWEDMIYDTLIPEWENRGSPGTFDAHAEVQIPTSAYYVGNPALDSTAAFQAALNSLDKDCRLHFPGGVFYGNRIQTGGDVNNGRNIEIIGADAPDGITTVLFCTENDVTYANPSCFFEVSMTRFRAQHITFAGLSTGGAQAGVLFTAFGDGDVETRFQNVVFVKLGRGIWAWKGRNFYFDNCLFSQCRYGINIWGWDKFTASVSDYWSIMKQRNLMINTCRWHITARESGACIDIDPGMNFNQVVVNNSQADYGGTFFNGFASKVSINNVVMFDHIFTAFKFTRGAHSLLEVDADIQLSNIQTTSYIYNYDLPRTSDSRGGFYFGPGVYNVQISNCSTKLAGKHGYEFRNEGLAEVSNCICSDAGFSQDTDPATDAHGFVFGADTDAAVSNCHYLSSEWPQPTPAGGDSSYWDNIGVGHGLPNYAFVFLKTPKTFIGCTAADIAYVGGAWTNQLQHHQETLTFGADVQPFVDLTSNLGASSKRWAQIHGARGYLHELEIKQQADSSENSLSLSRYSTGVKLAGMRANAVTDQPWSAALELGGDDSELHEIVGYQTSGTKSKLALNVTGAAGIFPQVDNVMQCGGTLNAWVSMTTYGVNNLSDARIKDVVGPIGSGALSIVDALVPVTYRLKADAPDALPLAGLIAQDVASTLDAAGTGRMGIVSEPDDGETGRWAIDYSRLTAVLVKAVQELKAEIDVLKGA